MAQIVLGAVGAVVGSFIPGVGTALGWAVGSAIGGAYEASRQKIVSRQPLIDLRIAGAEYGRPIPYARGTFRTAGDIWWNSDRVAVTTTTEEGGKGGGPTVVNETTTYKADFLIGLTDNRIVGVSRVWDNGKLIYNVRSNATTETVAASVTTTAWERITVYTGSDTQLPDPDYAAAVGVANAPAYRGRSYVFIKGRNLGQSGQVTNLTFEVIVDGELGAIPEPRAVDISETENDSPGIPIAFVDPVTDWIWHTPYTTVSTNLEVTVVSDTLESQVATFSESVSGSLIRPGSIFSVAPLNEVWIFCRNLGGPNPQVAIFDAGIADQNGSVIQAPTFKEFVTIGGVSYQDCAFYDESIGYVISAGALTNNQPTIVGVIETITRTLFYSLSTGVTIGTPTDISGKTPFVGISGVSGPVSPTPNFMVYDMATNSVVSTSRTTHGVFPYHMVFDPEREQFFVLNDSSMGFDVVEPLTGSVTSVTLTAAAGGDTSPPQSTLTSGITYSPALDKIIFGAEAVASNGSTLYIVNPESLQTEYTYTYETGASNYQRPLMAPTNGFSYYVYSFDKETPRHVKRLYFHAPTLTPGEITIEECQRDVCERCGLLPSEFDVTALSSITKPVRSFVWSEVSSARAVSETLMAAYFYEATTSDKIYFVPRGGSAVASIPFADLVVEGGSESSEPLPLRKSNDLETPSQVAVTYINVDWDYQDVTELSDRLISTSDTSVLTVAVALGMTASEGKGVADVMIMDRAASNISASLLLTGEYARLEPTDPVEVSDEDGSVYRFRIVTKGDSYPTLKFELVLDDPAALISQGITSVDYESQTEVALSPDTVMALMDIPLLRDDDDGAGFYVAAAGTTDSYPGAAIIKSSDNVNYSRVATVNESAVIGRTLTALGDWGGSRVFDDTNILEISAASDALSPRTRESILNDYSVNALLIGNEIIQFVNEELVATNHHRISKLLRGSRGTEWAMTGHVAGERVVLLRSAGIRRVPMQSSELSFPRYYKGVTIGQSESLVTAEVFANMGVGLKPFSPDTARPLRDGSGDLDVTIYRRSRYSVRAIGALGIYIPLAEETERYEIDILNGFTVVRTIIAATNTFEYTAAQQTSDFGSTQNQIAMKIYQISAVVGRGYPLEITL